VSRTVGNYELLSKIAEGGMGSIYKGRHKETGETVAVKIMHPHMATNEVLLKRLEQEFKAASRLNHPNIVRALDFGQSGGEPYLVMEFVDGESLGQKLEREGRMSEAESIRLIAQVAQGLHRAHKQKLIHRDVKPDNILLTRDGQAKLADLGLVKEMHADLNLTRTGRGLGTPHFMAPEQFRDAKKADERCDIYSLGATLYHMVTGELPFKSTHGPLEAWMKKMQNELTPPRELVPSVSERVDWAIRRAMSGDKEQRPGSCREFVEDLTGHSTRRVNTAELNAAVQDVWYLIYCDDEGEQHTVKGSMAAIRRSLKDGLLGDASNVLAGRTKNGPFEPLRSYPEFRDLVVVPAPLTVPSSSSGAVNAPRPSGAPSNPRGRPEGSRKLPPGGRPDVPEIALGAEPGAGAVVLEWVKWSAFLLFVAGLTAVVAWFLLFRQ
jgi:serine/threonine protein kinase